MDGTSWFGCKGCLQIVVAVGTVALTALITAALLFRREKSQARLPPGPRGWPVVGSLPSMEPLIHRSLWKLSARYGPLVYLHLGYVPVLVVSSPEMAKEVLKTHDQKMASRPVPEAVWCLTYQLKELAFAPLGERFRTLRKIFLMELFSPSRIRQFEAMRQREIMSAIHAILEQSKRGEPSVINDFMATVSVNEITQMMMNRRYCVADRSSISAEGVELNKIIYDGLEIIMAFHIADFIPVFRGYDVDGHHKRLIDIRDRLDKFMNVIIDEHRTKPSSGGTPEDFIDVLLRLSVDGKTTTDETVKAVFLNLITANDSPTTAVEWVLANLMKHPDTMRKLQDELDVVVGRDRLVEESDIGNLQYLQAAVKETLRLYPTTPLLIPRESTEDCNIAGYHIPAKTRIFVNTFAIQRDPAVWENPLEFNPDRFLNSTVDLKGSHYNLLPFGSGRRICPALNLGLLRVQHMAAQLVHTVTWSLPRGQKLEDLDMMERVGITSPKKIPLQAMAEPRLSASVLYSITEK